MLNTVANARDAKRPRACALLATPVYTYLHAKASKAAQGRRALGGVAEWSSAEGFAPSWGLESFPNRFPNVSHRRTKAPLEGRNGLTRRALRVR